MKTLFKIFAVALAATGMIACGNDGTGQPAGRLGVSSSELTFEAEKVASKTLKVTGADWTSDADAQWITITPTEGIADASFTVTVTDNEGEERSGTITVTNAKDSKDTQTVTVKQSAVGVVPSIGIDRTEITFDQYGVSEEATVTVSGNDWRVGSEASWFYMDKTMGASGESFTVKPQANPREQERTATITVTNVNDVSDIRTITVTQEPATPKIGIDADVISFDVDGVAETPTVTVSGNAWTADDNADWITVTPASGAAGASFTVTVTANTGDVREGTVTITNTELDTDTKTVTVRQAPLLPPTIDDLVGSYTVTGSYSESNGYVAADHFTHTATIEKVDDTTIRIVNLFGVEQLAAGGMSGGGTRMVWENDGVLLATFNPATSSLTLQNTDKVAVYNGSYEFFLYTQREVFTSRNNSATLPTYMAVRQDGKIFIDLEDPQGYEIPAGGYVMAGRGSFSLYAPARSMGFSGFFGVKMTKN